MTKSARLTCLALALLTLITTPLFSQKKPDCGFISAGKLEIYYCRQGQGPAVLFLHAGFLDQHQWDKQIAFLARNHRVISIDLPGHGRSLGVDTIRIAEVIRRVMKGLQMTNASLVGISLGASCALDFAIAHPEMTNKLVLCSPGLNGWQEVMKLDTLSKRLFVRNDSFTDTHDPELITENFVHLWLDGPFRKTAPVDTAVRGYVFRTAFAKISSLKGSGPVFSRRKAARRVKQLRKPVMIVLGSMDVPFIAQVSAYLHRNIKGSKLNVITGAAHLLNLERPDLCNQYLGSWLK